MASDEVEPICGHIEAAEGFEQLRSLRESVLAKLQEELPSSDPAEWNRKTNLIHDKLIRRTIQLSEKLLQRQGMGTPPVPYAFVLFGSGGRSEQTLWSDQDNGLIYQAEMKENAPEGGVEDYFHVLVGCILHGLEILGYPPCHGNVLSTNPRWRKSLDDWKEMIDRWFAESDWESVRYLLILADMRFLYGDERLGQELSRYYLASIESNPEIIGLMLQNTLHHKVSLGVFGQLIRERYGEHAGGVDIKYGAYIPFINGIRLLSIAFGMNDVSTLGRMQQFAERSFVPPPLLKDWARTFGSLLKLRSLAPHRLDESGAFSTEGKLPSGMLTKELKEELKDCLNVCRELQKFVKKTVIGR